MLLFLKLFHIVKCYYDESLGNLLSYTNSTLGRRPIIIKHTLEFRRVVRGGGWCAIAVGTAPILNSFADDIFIYNAP